VSIDDVLLEDFNNLDRVVIPSKGWCTLQLSNIKFVIAKVSFEKNRKVPTTFAHNPF
jgi:hypothetical protein